MDAVSTKTISIYDVAELGEQAFGKAFSFSNITSAFKATGIYPLNRQIFPEDAFLPSAVTNRPCVDGHATVTPKTTPHISQAHAPTTSQTHTHHLRVKHPRHLRVKHPQHMQVKHPRHLILLSLPQIMAHHSHQRARPLSKSEHTQKQVQENKIKQIERK